MSPEPPAEITDSASARTDTDPQAVFGRRASSSLIYAPTLADRWRATWSRGHSVATLIVAPLLFWAYLSAAGYPAGVEWYILIAGSAIGGAVIMASYLPTGRKAAEFAAPCAWGALLTPWLAGLLISGPSASPTQAALAFGIIGVGLAQRYASPLTCGPTR